MQVFDQKKFKKKDQGFLGVINIRVGDLMNDLSPDADGRLLAPSPHLPQEGTYLANLAVLFKTR